MSAMPLEIKFSENWSKLSIVEKESLLNIAKQYVLLKEEMRPQTIEEYNQEIDEALKRVEGGEFFTHEEVKKMLENL